jgi:hypothetical protein
MQASATGISWYRKGDYAAILALFTDAAGLPATFEEWLAQAKGIERQIKRTGGRAIRAYIDPVEFPKWCQQTGNKLDASGRMAFGSAFAAETLTKERAAASTKTKSWKIP